MFRESDERERHLHNSYQTKPVSIIQAASQISHLDESGLQQNITRQDVFHQRVPEAVPATYDVVYDPSHPDADWSGMVSTKFHHKKHSSNHSSQRMGIEQNEHGIVAKVEKQEWGHRRQPEGAAKNNSQILLAGINNDEDRFKTEYRRFANQESTSREQLTLDKRQKAVRSIPDPAQARSLRDRHAAQSGEYGYTGTTPRYGSEYPASPGMNQNESPYQQSAGQQYQQSGYGASNSATLSKKSFLDGIADSISKKVPEPPRVSNNDSTFSKNRILVTDNYQMFPGYTGRRKS